MGNYDKPFKTYKEQLLHLEQTYKLTISNHEFAINALKHMSYYDLVNGYKDCMMENNIFKDGITIEFLYMFYLYDRGFQNILLKQFIFIENYFKTTLAYVLSEKFGVHQDEYLDTKNYINKRNLYFSDIKRNIEKIYNSEWPPQPTKHYLKNHNHVPAWILFKNISFSNTINLLTLLKPTEKKLVVNEIIPDELSYDKKISFLIPALNLIRNFRNKIAHNLKFVTYKVNPTYQLPPKIVKSLIPNDLLSWDDIHEHRGLNDIYASIILINYFLKDPYLMDNFYNELLGFILPINDTPNEKIKDNLFKEYSTITNLPSDLIKRLTTSKENLIKIARK